MAVKRLAPGVRTLVVGRDGAPVRERPATNSPIISVLMPGIIFQGLWRKDRAWAHRLPSLGGGYIESARVREII